jgi:hypothetical protein
MMIVLTLGLLIVILTVGLVASGNMRALLFIVCAGIAAYFSVLFLQEPAPGWHFAPEGVFYSRPNYTPLGIAIFFGLCAIGVLFQGSGATGKSKSD